MKINRKYTMSLLAFFCFSVVAQKTDTPVPDAVAPKAPETVSETSEAPETPEAKTRQTPRQTPRQTLRWDKDSQAVYDLLVAQMQNAGADYAGSVDTLIKFAKTQKDDQLFAKAYRTLLQTERYADAVDLASVWKDSTKHSVDRFYILALVLNKEIDKAYGELTTQLENAPDDEDAILFENLQLFMSHWFMPQSLQIVDKLYNDYPDNALINDAYVKQLRWQGDTDKAVSVLDKLLFDDPRDLSLIQEKSDAYRYALRLTEAENVWKNLLKDYPNEDTFRFAYAQFLYDKYDFKQAKAMLALVDEKEMALSVATLKMMIKIQLGEYQDVDKVFAWDNLNDHQKNTAYFNMGDMLLRKKQDAQALTMFEKIDKNAKMALAADLKIAEIKYRDSIDSGNAWFDDVQKRHHLDRDFAVREKANAMEKAGREQEGFQLLNDFLKANPKNEDIRYSRALMAAELQQEAQAIEDLKRLHTTSPENTDVQNALGYTLLGHPEELDFADELIKKSLFSNPSSPAVVDSMGWALYQKKQYDKALPFFRYAYSQFLDGEIIGHYVMALAAAGQMSAAKKLYHLEMQYEPSVKKMQRITKPLREALK